MGNRDIVLWNWICQAVRPSWLRQPGRASSLRGQNDSFHRLHSDEPKCDIYDHYLVSFKFQSIPRTKRQLHELSNQHHLAWWWRIDGTWVHPQLHLYNNQLVHALLRYQGERLLWLPIRLLHVLRHHVSLTLLIEFRQNETQFNSFLFNIAIRNAVGSAVQVILCLMMRRYTAGTAVYLLSS